MSNSRNPPAAQAGATEVPVIARHQRPAVVLSCAGAPEGDLNLVRSLGARGVPVWVLTEYADAPSIRSRYCLGHRIVPGYTREPDRLLEALRALRTELQVAPVVFASADPDLAALIALHEPLQEVVLSTVVDPALSGVLSDKQRFNHLVRDHDLPVPRTWSLGNAASLQTLAQAANFPLILKPAQPAAWQRPGLDEAVRDSKALRVDDAPALAMLAAALQTAQAETMVQEFVPGPDEAHMEVQVYIDRAGRVAATYSGRKWRIYPPHAGSGCFVETVAEADLEALAAGLLSRLGYRGLANMDFKRHERTGQWLLFEINPRVSQWHILPTRSGVDLPWLAYCDACGQPPGSFGPRRVGMHYLNEVRDWHALRIYRRERLWTLGRWSRQIFALALRGRLVFQLADPRDPQPALMVFGRALRSRWQRLVGGGRG